MKALHKTLAFVFTAVAFTACTNASIEPLQNTTSPQAMVTRPDTTYKADLSDSNEQNTYGLHGQVTPAVAVNPIDDQPATVAEHLNYPKPHVAPHQEPRQTVLPVVKSDSLNH